MLEAYGWRIRLEHALDPMGSGDLVSGEEVEAAANHAQGVNRLLQTDMAIGLYRRDVDRLPADLRDLAPDYLPIVPIDPFSNRPLQYRPAGDDFVLYSVGWDGRDDGGAFAGAEAYRAAKGAGEPGFDLWLDLGDR